STARSWLAVNQNHLWLNVAAQRADADSVLSFYKRLIALRESEDVLTTGSFTLLEPDHDALWAYLREDAANRLLVLANVSDKPVDLPAGEPFSRLDQGSVLLANYPGSSTSASLQPWEFRAVYV